MPRNRLNKKGVDLFTLFNKIDHFIRMNDVALYFKMVKLTIDWFD
jgi:hypothetical protein